VLCTASSLQLLCNVRNLYFRTNPNEFVATGEKLNASIKTLRKVRGNIICLRSFTSWPSALLHIQFLVSYALSVVNNPVFTDMSVPQQGFSCIGSKELSGER